MNTWVSDLIELETIKDDMTYLHKNLKKAHMLLSCEMSLGKNS